MIKRIENCDLKYVRESLVPSAVFSIEDGDGGEITFYLFRSNAENNLSNKRIMKKIFGYNVDVGKHIVVFHRFRDGRDFGYVAPVLDGSCSSIHDVFKVVLEFIPQTVINKWRKSKCLTPFQLSLNVQDFMRFVQ